MPRVMLVLVALLVAGCAGPQPPACGERPCDASTPQPPASDVVMLQQCLGERASLFLPAALADAHLPQGMQSQAQLGLTRLRVDVLRCERAVLPDRVLEHVSMARVTVRVEPRDPWAEGQEAFLFDLVVDAEPLRDVLHTSGWPALLGVVDDEDASRLTVRSERGWMALDVQGAAGEASGRNESRTQRLWFGPALESHRLEQVGRDGASRQALFESEGAWNTSALAGDAPLVGVSSAFHEATVRIHLAPLTHA